jgi:hypothetical protein
MVITADEYKNKFVKTKTVNVDEGIDFEIKQISPIDFLEQGKNGLISPDEQVKMLLLKGVVLPKLSDKDEEGKINIRDIKTEHLSKLTKAILIYSDLQTEDGKPKDFFSDTVKE